MNKQAMQPTLDQKLKNAAIATGAVAAGGGVAYAGWRAGKAADQVGRTAAEMKRTARNATAITAGVRHTGRKIERASAFIRRTVGKIPGMRRFGLAAKVRAVIELAEAKKEKKGLNPYVGAALSGGASGALLGMVPILRRGTKLRTVLKSAAGMGAASAAIVGGGAKIGSKIIGDPKADEGAAFTKRAAIGGTIAGAAIGGAGALVLKKVPGARRALRGVSREWRPAMWMRRAGPAGAAGIGAVAGGAYGLAQGADEGQQVDSIINMRKDMKRKTGRQLAARVRAVIELASTAREHWRGARVPLQQDEAGIPFSGVAAKDRLIKQIRDEDLARRDSNILKAGAAGAVAGAAASSKRIGLRGRAGIGAGLGAAAVLAIRRATHGRRDVYGERQRYDKVGEKAPAVAGLGAAALLAKKRFRLARGVRAIIEFGKADQPRYAANKQYADPLRAYGSSATLVDAAGNPSHLTQSQLVNAAWRSGQGLRKWGKRTSNLVQDTADLVTGRPKPAGRKREYEKEWFRNTVATAAGAGSLLGHAVLRRKIPAYRMKTDAVEAKVRSVIAKGRKKLDGTLGLGRRVRLVLLDARAAEVGWDVRDPRGKSARVFAPGAQRRQRRPAEWHETKDGQRKIIGGLGLAGTLAGVGAGVLIGKRIGAAAKLRRKAGISRGYMKQKITRFPEEGLPAS